MDSESLLEAVRCAERHLAGVTARLRDLQAAWFLAGEHDARRLTQLVGEYGQARQALREAQRAWLRWQHAQEAPPPAPAPPPGPPPAPAAAPPALPTDPLRPTPALRFARWLYEHGYIGEGYA